jgi:type II secretory pathway component PulK
VTPAETPRGREGEEGIVLLLVLVLVVVAISTAYAMSKTSLIEVLATRQSAQHTRAELLARSGIGLAERALLDDLIAGTDLTRSVESPLDAWALLSRQEIELPGGALLRVRIHDAANKININALVDAEGKRVGEDSRNFLREVFSHLRDTAPEFKGSSALDDQQVDDLSDAILDWLDKDDETRVGTPESEYYVEIKKAKSPPLNRPVFSLDELAPVPGMTPLLLEALKAYFTPYPMFPGSDGGGVNLNTAPPHVLGLIYHGVAGDQRMLGQREVFEILKARSEGKVFCPAAGAEPCVTFNEVTRLAEGEPIFPALTFTSRVFAVDSEAVVGETRACVHSVIDRGTGGETKTLFYELGC